MAFLAQVSTQQVITKSISTLTLAASSITDVSLLTANVISTQRLTVQSSLTVVGRSVSSPAFFVTPSSQVGLNMSTPVAQFHIKDLSYPTSDPPIAIFDKDPTSVVTANQTYLGSYVLYTVPAAVTSITFNLWGAGGIIGGGGAFVQATVPTTPGEQLRFIIGLGGSLTALDPTDPQGGAGSNVPTGQDGRGGGRTAVQKFIGGQWVEVLTAGGGGGGTTAFGGFSGGNARWIGTSDSGQTAFGAAGGGGGTQSSGGAGGGGGGFFGGSGTFQKGGVSRSLGGSGGGGYYGGGGGYTGGGGASFVLSTIGGSPFVTNYTGINGNGGTPIATTAFGYVSGVGVAGGNGLLALQYNGFRESDYLDMNRGGTTIFSINSLGGIAVSKSAVTPGYSLDIAGNVLASQGTYAAISTQSLAVSTVLNPLRVGTVSSLTSINFPGLTGLYQGTAVAEISTGSGTQELLLYKVSSATDRVRVQTTGTFVVETGVSARSWPVTSSNVTPAFVINASSNVGIQTATPGATLDVAGTGRFQQVSTLSMQVSTINGQPFGSFSGSTNTLSAASILVSSINGGIPVLLPNLVSTTQGLGTLGYVSSVVFASYSFFTVSSGTSYTQAPYGQELVTLSNLSYQFAPIQLSNDGITLLPSTGAATFTYRVSYMAGVNQATFMTPRPTLTMAISTPSNVVYYPAVESIDAGGGTVSFLENLNSNSQILFYMNGLSNYTFTDADTSLYRVSFEQVMGSVGQVYSTTYVATSLADFTSTATFYENVTMKKSTFMSNVYVSLSTSTSNLYVSNGATILNSTITDTLYTNYLRVMCNAIIGPSSVTIEANNIQTSNLQTSSLSLLDQSTLTYKPFFISSGTIYYGSNAASAGGGGGTVTATGGSTLSSLFVGSSSNQNFIKFWGSIGEYNNTVISQQSTGGGTNELLFFEGSSINDQIRFQTTGGIRFETGVAGPRNFCNANQITTPTVFINSSSNVGILTNNPTFTLDVAGTGRFQTLLSSPTATIGALLVGVFIT